jgi:hypothetical protein
MDNQNTIDLMIILQTISLIIAGRERVNITREWKSWTIDKKIGRSFFLFLPTLVILSLLNNPL